MNTTTLIANIFLVLLVFISPFFLDVIVKGVRTNRTVNRHCDGSKQ